MISTFATVPSLRTCTVSTSWPVIRRVLERELGRTRMAELDIDPVPIGAASLGQVHLARRRADDRALCLKVQYPGVADSIDADIDAVVRLLEIGRLVAAGEEFRSWLEEVREMLHREVDYTLEAAKTQLFHERLKRDPRFVVPGVVAENSTAHVLATSF